MVIPTPITFKKIKVSYVREIQFYTNEENSKQSEPNPALLHCK
jgi:hypothetical protein